MLLRSDSMTQNLGRDKSANGAGGVSTGGAPRGSQEESQNRNELAAGIVTCGDEDSEKCPICWDDLGHSDDIASVIGCGHKFCATCIKAWADRARGGRPICPRCTLPFTKVRSGTVATDVVTDVGEIGAIDGKLPWLVVWLVVKCLLFLMIEHCLKGGTVVTDVETDVGEIGAIGGKLLWLVVEYDLTILMADLCLFFIAWILIAGVEI